MACGVNAWFWSERLYSLVEIRSGKVVHFESGFFRQREVAHLVYCQRRVNVKNNCRSNPGFINNLWVIVILSRDSHIPDWWWIFDEVELPGVEKLDPVSLLDFRPVAEKCEIDATEQITLAAHEHILRHAISYLAHIVLIRYCCTSVSLISAKPHENV
jgi:hypothetical protein